MSPQELQVQQKREIEKKQESTIPARSFVPTADIFEAEPALTIAVIIGVVVLNLSEAH